MTKLNGWRRLGIVVCAAWILGVVSLAVYEGTYHLDGYFVGLTLPVGTVVSGDKATLPDGRVVNLNMTLNGKPAKPWQIKWDNEPEIPTVKIVYWQKLLVYAFAFPMLLWAGTEFLVFISAWVRRGFRAGNAS